LIVWNSKY